MKVKINKKNILIIDDEEGIRKGLQVMLTNENYKVFTTGNALDASDIVTNETIDIAIMDINLKDKKSGIDLLKEFKKIVPQMSILMITGYGCIETAIESMKWGASDYLLKPIDRNKLLDVIKKNCELKELRNDNQFLKTELLENVYTYNFITRNPETTHILQTIDKVKNSSTTILLTGESGTGKEVMARYAHFTSNRKNGNFVGINSAALSESLLLSELFGHEKGAFTGAVSDKIGKFELANNGTLFLDEIGDMSLDVQAKLLRVLEANSFERVGGTKKINVNVRLITATNKDLVSLINEGKFRKDLYYRINVMSFNLLPLRKRVEDIEVLVENFIKKFNLKYNKNIIINENSFAQLKAHLWPGNIRELRNVVDNAVLLTEDSQTIKFNFQTESLNKCEDDDLISSVQSEETLKGKMDSIIEYYEKKIIKEALIANQFSKTKTADQLNINRKTLSNKIEKYKL
ncbi:sigma-54-dependent Fis family transcriptional regulator [Oceanispirochaeta crateris]|uniref:Sigma-54-dependent Fis family transcriptional regulator n=1 Tax=Oceanispirochaeta crateris TaxID=2518645 RepID=A0A5C1QP72_9SPIO|nr:sigma-54 dependent transcriptional regulator [Oceanispirochaeta crateris]QEN08364.1 sigma-54-dependent Fis family transcriptional regulator [Oceanispirochaeta crateris]